MKLLLISNSTNPGEEYLDYPKNNIRDFLGPNIKKVLFIPYAAVTFSFDEYQQKVQERFAEIGYEVDSIHHYPFQGKKQAIKDAEAIVIGGGNTFQLLKLIQQQDLIETIRYEALKGKPFVGWSAGSNVACPTICTTNDMPIVEPESFHATNLVRFQINPHYLDANPEGHAGETREQRIQEFLVANPYIYVVGLREGTMLKIEDAQIKLIGPRKARIFKAGMEPRELGSDDDFDFLFE
ncbi:MAG: dipeptidase E [Bacteroidetes bacterium GWF2_33_16]|nr:MAG: dipeptidase E [Bacteroidetes bacterium GWE2_32_14]OFY04994.1 MAG: dipeptidase E [Bacteroidetes bacterium GWF2_33_16]